MYKYTHRHVGIYNVDNVFSLDLYALKRVEWPALVLSAEISVSHNINTASRWSYDGLLYLLLTHTP